MSQVSFQCPRCGSYEFRIDLDKLLFVFSNGFPDDPDWAAGCSFYCENCGAGLSQTGESPLDADFFWKALKGLAKKARGKNRESIQNALNGLVEYLTDCSLLEKKEWLELLQKRPDLAAKCPMGIFTSDDWEKLLIQCPELTSYCDWGSVSFSSEMWTAFLLKSSKLDAHCPWNILTSGDWVQLLVKRPELDAHCPWNILTSGDWVKLLIERPELDAHCPWNILTSGDWVKLLKARHELTKYCKWDILTSGDWLDLLLFYPGPMDRFCKWDVITPGDWGKLLAERPELNVYCKWDRISFSSRTWTNLLLKDPVFDAHCPWDVITSNDWGRLLKQRPELAQYCNWGVFVSGKDAAGMESVDRGIVQIIAADKRIKDYIDFGRLRNYPDLFYTVVEELNCAEECDWSFVRTGEAWCRIMARHPRLASVCDWELFSTRDWIDLLTQCPELQEYCTCWDRFSLDECAELLSAREKLKNHISSFDYRFVWNYSKFQNTIFANLSRRFTTFAFAAFLIVFSFISLRGQCGWFSLFGNSAKHAITSGTVWLVAGMLCCIGYGYGWGPQIRNRWLNLVYTGFAAFSLFTIYHWSFLFTRGSLGLILAATIMFFLFVFPLPGGDRSAYRLSMCLSPFFAVMNWFLLSPAHFSIWMVCGVILVLSIISFVIYHFWNEETSCDNTMLKYALASMGAPLLIGIWIALSPVSSDACYKMATSLESSFPHASKALFQKGTAADPDFAQLAWLDDWAGDDNAD